MGTTTKIKSVKCYNFNRVLQLLELDNHMKYEAMESFVERLYNNGCRIFTPPHYRGPGVMRHPEQYILTNSWFDKFMSEQNTWAVLKGKSPVKPGYKKYQEQSEILIFKI